MTLQPPIGITMGDPAGIGPEIIAAAMAKPNRETSAIVIGSASVMRRATDLVGADLTVRPIDVVEQATFRAGVMEVLETTSFANLPVPGRVSAECGRAAYDAIALAIRLALSGKVSAIVTAPINKAALAAAGIGFPGHTEILAAHSGGGRVAMMLANDDIRTVLVTVHVPLRQAIADADFDAQISAIRLANEGCRALGIARPRIAVCGLNPHAGEGGLFGHEEATIITPAIEAARKDGMEVSGPWPGDTVFMHARKGRFDVVVAQYHDQGLIPVKYLGVERGVNITLGLPFVRTSPDHGTAFDIAGLGTADSGSLETAIDYATRLAQAKPYGDHTCHFASSSC